MNTIEQRLADALNARADLVTQESLSPSAPPAPVVPLRRRFPRPAGYAVAAAACAAAVAAPFVIPALTGDEADPKPDPAPVVEIGVDWPVEQTRSYDVDGDGRDDEIRLKLEPAAPHDARVEVTLAGGETVGAVVESRGDELELDKPVQADGRPGFEISVHHYEVAGGGLDLAALLVLRDSELVVVTTPEPSPFTYQRDGDDRQHSWWIQERTLYSAVSADPYPSALPDVYAERRTRWGLDDDLAWVSEAAGTVCRDMTDLEAFPAACDRTDAGPDTTADDGFDDGASPFLDRSDAVIQVGESFQVDVDGGGADTFSLGSEGGEEWVLGASFAGGPEPFTALTPPEGAEGPPMLHTTLAEPAPGDAPLLVVRWGSVYGGLTQIYSTEGQQLTLLPWTSTFGGGRSEDGTSVTTVLTTNGTLYALNQVDAVEVGVYLWRAEGTTYMVLGNNGMSLGSWCKNEVDPDQPPYVEC